MYSPTTPQKVGFWERASSPTHLRPVAENNPAHLGVYFPGQLPRPGKELEGHPVLKVVPVVAEYRECFCFFVLMIVICSISGPD